jgi:hypothetical protein
MGGGGKFSFILDNLLFKEPKFHVGAYLVHIDIYDYIKFLYKSTNFYFCIPTGPVPLSHTHAHDGTQPKIFNDHKSPGHKN